MASSAPLRGVKVLEVAGIDRVHDAADMGADVLRIERNGSPDSTLDRRDARGRRSLTLDLKQRPSMVTSTSPGSGRQYELSYGA